MSRLLFVIGSLNRGGAERHLSLVAPALRKRGHDVQIQTLTVKGDLAPSVEANGVRVAAPPLAPLTGYLPRRLRERVRVLLSSCQLVFHPLTRRPDAVHCFLPHAYLAGGLAALIARVPVRIMSRRSLNHYQQRNRLLTRLEYRLHRHMSALVANSRAVRRQLLAEPGTDTSRVHLIYNGVDPRVSVRQTSRKTMRAALGLMPDEVVTIVVANLIPYKGHSDLLDALGLAAASMPFAWRVLCVGRDDGVGDRLRSHAHKLDLDDHLVWLGSRSDVPQLLAACDVGLLCSHEEGFSNAVLEGMAAGLPMIATDVGGNAEAVVDGVCGYVVPPRAPQALASALVSIARDRAARERMGHAARQRVEAHFTLDRCVDEYEALYRRLLDDREKANHF